MMTLRLDRADLGHVRFAFSPLWETVMSLRALATTSSGSTFSRVSTTGASEA